MSAYKNKARSAPIEITVRNGRKTITTQNLAHTLDAPEGKLIEIAEASACDLPKGTIGLCDDDSGHYWLTEEAFSAVRGKIPPDMADNIAFASIQLRFALGSQSEAATPRTVSAHAPRLTAPLDRDKTRMEQKSDTSQTANTHEPNITVIAGCAATTSMAVADFFGKRHDNVMRAIREIISADPEARLNFEESAREDLNGRLRPCYNMDRTGFVMLGMGFTGQRAIQWRRRYIAAFDRMEAELQHQAPAITADNRIALGRFRIDMLSKLRQETDATLRHAVHAELAYACEQLGEATPALESIVPAHIAEYRNICAEFWQAIYDLHEEHRVTLDHGTSPHHFAVNLKEACGAADFYDVPMPPRAVLLRALPHSKAPAFIDNNKAIRSGASGRVKRCWIFRVDGNAMADLGYESLLNAAAPDIAEPNGSVY